MSPRRVLVGELLWREVEAWLQDEVGLDPSRPSLEELRALASVDPARAPSGKPRGLVELLRDGVRRYLDGIDRWTPRLLTSALLGPAPLARAYGELGLPLVEVKDLPPQPSVNVLYWLVEHITLDGDTVRAETRSFPLVLQAKEERVDGFSPSLVLDLLQGKLDALYSLLDLYAIRVRDKFAVSRQQDAVVASYEKNVGQATVGIEAVFSIARPPSLVLRVKATISKLARYNTDEKQVSVSGLVEWYRNGLPHVTAATVMSGMKRVLLPAANAWLYYGDQGEPRLVFTPHGGLEAVFGAGSVKLHIASDMVKLVVPRPALAEAISLFTGAPMTAQNTLSLPRDDGSERGLGGMPLWVKALIEDGATLAGLYDRGIDPADLAEQAGKAVEQCELKHLSGGNYCHEHELVGASKHADLPIKGLARPVLASIIASRHFTTYSMLGAGALLSIALSPWSLNSVFRALDRSGIGLHYHLLAGFLDGLALLGYPDYGELTERFVDMYACPSGRVKNCNRLKAAIANSVNQAALIAYARRAWRISRANVVEEAPVARVEYGRVQLYMLPAGIDTLSSELYVLASTEPGGPYFLVREMDVATPSQAYKTYSALRRVEAAKLGRIGSIIVALGRSWPRHVISSRPLRHLLPRGVAPEWIVPQLVLENEVGADGG